MWRLYIVMWLEHHGNRLYGFMELLSKKLGKMGNTPKTVTTTRAPAVLIMDASELVPWMP